MKDTDVTTGVLFRTRTIAMVMACTAFSAPAARAGDPPPAAPASRPITVSANAPTDAAAAPEHPEADPNEIRRGMRMGGSRADRERQTFETAAKRVEPSMKGTPDRLPAYLDFFKRDFVRDPRIFAFNANAEVDSGGTLVLTGYAEYPEHKQSLETLLTTLGFNAIRNDIELLPSSDLGDRRFGIVTASHALLYDKSTKPRENMTEAMAGDCVRLLKATDDGYFLCHSGEGYTGFIEQSKVKVVSKDAYVAHLNGDHGVLLADARDASHFLPAGSRLDWQGTRDGRALLKDAIGNTYSVPANLVKPPTANRKALLDAVIANAFNLQGTKYVWGGRTSDGVDCSGLVQTSFAAHGVYLPRDADQQGLVGLLVATRDFREALRPGDVLFFMAKRGNIHHTALYIGNGQYIEAATPGAKVTSLDPAAPNYDKRRDETFCFAKRFVE